MKERNLLAILDKGIVFNKDIIKMAIDIMDGGVTFIQLRNKVSNDRVFYNEAKELRRITKEKGCTLIINDRVDVAKAVDADGVHLGQDDLPYKEARRLLGKDKIIGISTHNIKEAKEAEIFGADYIGVGPIFETETRPSLQPIGLEIVSKVSKEIRIPAYFIGGINLKNITQIIEKGGNHFAIASAILNSGDIAKTARAFVDILKERQVVIA